jgi:maleate isomerase
MTATMFRSDGWGWRARLGLLVPQADTCPESEFRAIAPDGVSVHATRVPFSARSSDGSIPMVGDALMRAYLEPPRLDDAAELMASAPVHVVALCFTNTSYLGPVEDDRRLVERLERRTKGIPVITTRLSAVTALRALGARRLAIANPPWIEPAITERAKAFFADAGLAVVFASTIAMPRNPSDAQPGRIYEWARAHVPADADAVFFGGNGCRTVGAIEAIEQDLGRPVLTANQVLVWHGLGLSRANVKVEGYGRIFDQPLPAN